MPNEFDGWKTLGEPLGKGGQGTVYLARSPGRVRELNESAARVERIFREIGTAIQPQRSQEELTKRAAEFAQALNEVGREDDPPAHLGALKKFEIPLDNKEEADQAVGRLKSEVTALSKINHPSILKLLHANIDGRFIVTQYHRRRTLDRDENLELFKANPLAALKAFRQLVEGVAEVHGMGLIHRDIKLQNIFVSDSGHLVLGDFGIVFYQDGTRLTTTFELVGSHFWMAPWAYKYQRLDLKDVKPSLDVYPLGKVLWSMVAGRRGFAREEFDRQENNLGSLFPDDPSMREINDLLRRCVVREEKDCSLSTAGKMLLAVDALLDKTKAPRGFRPADATSWPCPVCGKGNYRQENMRVRGFYTSPLRGQDFELEFFVCDFCKHAAAFSLS